MYSPQLHGEVETPELDHMFDHNPDNIVEQIKKRCTTVIHHRHHRRQRQRRNRISCSRRSPGGTLCTVSPGGAYTACASGEAAVPAVLV